MTDGWHLGYCAEDGKPGPSARHDHSAVVYGGAMWVFGGVMNLEAKSDLWCWNFGESYVNLVECHSVLCCKFIFYAFILIINYYVKLCVGVCACVHMSH